jgi:hypothetical protein
MRHRFSRTLATTSTIVPRASAVAEIGESAHAQFGPAHPVARDQAPRRRSGAGVAWQRLTVLSADRRLGKEL